jgi:hypothetical protein
VPPARCSPMSGSTPVGFLYTPQQLAGSVRYRSGVLLGNWREDDALDEMRMMDYIESKETGQLTLLKKQSKLSPQLATVPLTAPPADGVLHYGDVVLLQSMCTDGTLAVSLGQRLFQADNPEADAMYAAFASPLKGALARNAVKFVSYDGEGAIGQPVLYGQKVCLEFSSELGVTGYLSSMRSGRVQLATQLINKQEVYMQVPQSDKIPYDCAWTLLPGPMDERIISQGTPVVAGAPLLLTHCFTNKRLASVHVPLPTDFGTEFGVCAHTYTETGKVNKLMRESMGRPTNNLITRAETDENFWSILYA